MPALVDPQEEAATTTDLKLQDSCSSGAVNDSPLLGQGGVDATSIKCREASFEGADGVVGSTTDYSVV
jgi:hypothetical protein